MSFSRAELQDPNPIDGGWTEWTVWSQCARCGGLKARTRTCTNPAPAFGGLDCEGANTITQFCPNYCPGEYSWPGLLLREKRNERLHHVTSSMLP